MKSAEWATLSSGPRPAAPVVPGRKRKHAPLNHACIACGPANPKGLRLTFQRGGQEVMAHWSPGHDWESFRGTIHGGILTTAMDEAMSQAIIARDWEAFTVELRVRFRGRVSPREELQVEGWVVERKKRKILAEAAIRDTSSKERAHAWGTFLVPPGD